MKPKNAEHKHGYRLLLMAVIAVLFAVFFFIGILLAHRQPSSENSGTPPFSDRDYDTMWTGIKSAYDEEVRYVTTEPSGLQSTLDGAYYYDVSFLVCRESSDQVDVFIFMKYMTETSYAKVGEIVLEYSGVSSSYTKADLFPEWISNASDSANDASKGGS